MSTKRNSKLFDNDKAESMERPKITQEENPLIGMQAKGQELRTVKTDKTHSGSDQQQSNMQNQAKEPALPQGSGMENV